MERLTLFLSLFVLLFLSSCKQEHTEFSLLHQADALMEHYPDSALTLLDNMALSQGVSKKERAYYALLRTQAEDKNYVLHTTDSLILVAVDYYKNRWNAEEKARAYFYLGCVYRDMKLPVKQIEAYLAALKAKGSKKDRMAMLIHSNLTKLYKNHGLYEKSTEMGKKAYEISLGLDNEFDQICLARNLAFAHQLEKKDDSAFVYFKDALHLSEVTHEKDMEVLLLAEIGDLLYGMDRKDSACYYFEKHLQVVPRENIGASMRCSMGRIYHRLGQPDSARFYLLSCLNDGNLYVRASSRANLAAIEKEAGNLDLALMYNEEYIELENAIDASSSKVEINAAAIKHLWQEEMEDRLMMLKRVGGILLLFLAGVLSLFLRRKKQKRELSKEELSFLPSLEEALLPVLQIENDRFAACLHELQTTPGYEIIKQVLDNQEEARLSKEEREIVEEDVRNAFTEIIDSLKQRYPKLTKDDLYCCVLHLLGCRASAVEAIMCVESGTLRVRKTRIRQKIDSKVYEAVFNSQPSVN